MSRILLAAALSCAAMTGALAAQAKLKPGDIAPAFVRTDISGHPIDLHALRGKVVLIDFWASWCAPCMVEIPHLIDLKKRHGAAGFDIIGVSMDDSLPPVKTVAAHYPFNYPLLLGDAKFGLLYGGVLGLPMQMLVGRDGKILAVWRGEVSPDKIESAVKAALSS